MNRAEIYHKEDLHTRLQHDAAFFKNVLSASFRDQFPELPSNPEALSAGIIKAFAPEYTFKHYDGADKVGELLDSLSNRKFLETTGARLVASTAIVNPEFLPQSSLTFSVDRRSLIGADGQVLAGMRPNGLPVSFVLEIGPGLEGVETQEDHIGSSNGQTKLVQIDENPFIAKVLYQHAALNGHKASLSQKDQPADLDAQVVIYPNTMTEATYRLRSKAEGQVDAVLLSMLHNANPFDIDKTLQHVHHLLSPAGALIIAGPKTTDPYDNSWGALKEVSEAVMGKPLAVRTNINLTNAQKGNLAIFVK